MANLGRLRLLSPIRHLHRAPGGPLGQEEDGPELLRDLHLLLPHQALLQLLVAVHREDLWRYCHLNALLNLRVMVSIFTSYIYQGHYF